MWSLVCQRRKAQNLWKTWQSISSSPVSVHVPHDAVIRHGSPLVAYAVQRREHQAASRSAGNQQGHLKETDGAQEHIHHAHAHRCMADGPDQRKAEHHADLFPDGAPDFAVAHAHLLHDLEILLIFEPP